MICPIIGGVVLVGSMVMKSLKKNVSTPPEPKPLPVAVYGEDLED
jgi:hypothetical protein